MKTIFIQFIILDNVNNAMLVTFILYAKYVLLTEGQVYAKIIVLISFYF